MTQSGGTHGRVQDDARKKEVRSEVRAGRATRAEEWLEPEPPGDDQPEATWVLAGYPGAGSVPSPDDIQLRSDVARYLDRAAFPARRGRLLETLTRHAAPQQLIDLVGSLPGDTEFSRAADVFRALGLPAEARD